MQPYQEAGAEITRQQEAPGKALQGAGKLGASLVGGGALLQRILPLLSNLIPSGLAAKGLAKVDPRFGKFIQGAVNNGQTQDDAIGFIRQKVEEAQKPGESERVEALNKFKEKKNKAPGMVQDLQNRFTEQYGHPQQPGGRQPFQGPGVNQQPGSQQQGGTDQAILSALEKILSM